MSRSRIIFVLGATGTGKSNLGIEISKKFNGEIVSADSMQIYKGLDITSNKVTELERQGVPHYMMDVLEPHQRCTVVDFRNQALVLIENILSRGKLPIIVGGTNYYIESLLWNTLVDNTDKLTFNTSTDDILLSDKIWITKNVENNNLNALLNKEDNLKIDEQYSLMGVVKVMKKFKDIVSAITSAISIPWRIYRNTFYTANSKNINENLNVDDCAGLNIDVNMIEEKLICEYVSRNLAGLVCPQNEIFNAEFVTSLANDARLFPDLDILMRIESSCGSISQELKSSVEDIIRTRIRRLRLLRVIDDENMSDFSDEILHSELQIVDSEIAAKLHPRNRRKVLRALQVYMQRGCPISRIWKLQKNNESRWPLRFEEPCILWIQCAKNYLERRLEERVDEMIENGLITEIVDFYEKYKNEPFYRNYVFSGETPSYTKGILQSIGLDEFHSYVTLSEEERNSKAGQKILKECIQNLKNANRRYANYQAKWIEKRFLKDRVRQLPPVFGLDGTLKEHWKQNVEEISLKIVEDYVSRGLSSIAWQPEPVLPVDNADPDSGGQFYCDICERIFVGNRLWQLHMSSNNHKRRVQGLFKKKKDSVASM